LDGVNPLAQDAGLNEAYRQEVKPMADLIYVRISLAISPAADFNWLAKSAEARDLSGASISFAAL
jgi:hypothetical protein